VIRANASLAASKTLASARCCPGLPSLKVESTMYILRLAMPAFAGERLHAIGGANKSVERPSAQPRALLGTPKHQLFLQVGSGRPCAQPNATGTQRTCEAGKGPMEAAESDMFLCPRSGDRIMLGAELTPLSAETPCAGLSLPGLGKSDSRTPCSSPTQSQFGRNHQQANAVLVLRCGNRHSQLNLTYVLNAVFPWTLVVLCNR
jgi:hypothetical protein